MILLAIGLIGELMFSVSGLMGICTTKMWKSFATTLIAAHVSRIVQAVFQCCLICIASKLKVSSKRKHEAPGKQTITFLIIVNIAIFIMNLFESDKVGTSEAVVNFYGKQNWVFLVRTFSPLTIFFRFHSSVYNYVVKRASLNAMYEIAKNLLEVDDVMQAEQKSDEYLKGDLLSLKLSHLVATSDKKILALDTLKC
uniref:Uncharacterized protein n=1 Tax=Panagrolaimus davidi TaxID=227884 RepID=A0A914PUM2_9BILA